MAGNRITVDEYNQVKGYSDVFAIVKVAVNRAVKYFTYEKANRLMIKKYIPGKEQY